MILCEYLPGPVNSAGVHTYAYCVIFQQCGGFLISCLLHFHPTKPFLKMEGFCVKLCFLFSCVYDGM